MRSTMVPKSELREIVQRNRDAHRAVFDEAFTAFGHAAERRLEHHLEILRDGGTPPLHLNLVVPEDHTDDYDTVLLMLDMETRDEIELSWDEFRNYVQDEWGWTGRFNETTSTYLGGR